jgi:hypothetical protein
MVSATGNVSGGNLLLTGNIFDSGTALQINTTTAANIALAPNSSIVLTATTTGANITGTLNATGNANVGNLGTAGLVTATGNVSGGNLTTGAQVVATGNVTGGNLITAGLVVATGNITGGNLITAGLISTTNTTTGIESDGNVTIKSRKILFLNDDDNSNYIGLRSPGTLTGNFTYTFPTGYGNNTQVLTTNGAGGLTWEDAGTGGGSGATSFPNSTVQPVPGATGNFDLSYNFAQTVQETPFEAAGTDAFGVNLGEVYSMMDPVGEILDPVDLGVLT